MAFNQNIKFSQAEIDWLDSIEVSQEYRQAKIKINNKWYFVDAYDPTTNTIYEFYGDYWHGNPKVHHPYKINKRVNKTFIKLYNETLKKEKILKQAGYKVVSIWESDWKENQNEQE